MNGQHGISVSESTALTEAVLTGMGIGQIFSFSACAHIAAGRLVPILEQWAPPSHPLQLVYTAARHPSAKLRVFIDWVIELFSRENLENCNAGQRAQHSADRLSIRVD